MFHHEQSAGCGSQLGPCWCWVLLRADLAAPGSSGEVVVLWGSLLSVLQQSAYFNFTFSVGNDECMLSQSTFNSFQGCFIYSLVVASGTGSA